MLKIRLQRVGRKNDPSFRAVCVDSRRGPKVGKHTEVLGSYDPKRNYIAINGERVKHWISKGAQVSDTMHNLLVKEGIIKAKKIHVSRGKKKVEAEAEAKEETKEETSESAPVETPTEEKPAEEAPKPTSTDSSSQGGEEVKEEPKEDVKEEVAPEKKEVV